MNCIEILKPKDNINIVKEFKSNLSNEQVIFITNILNSFDNDIIESTKKIIMKI